MLHWFHHPDIPEFTICARCYVGSIFDTKFRDSFTGVYRNDAENRMCRFQSRRLKDNLFTAAIESGRLDECVAFMKKRMAIKDCPQLNEIEGQEWYMAADIPHGTICQACFEDGISVSPFAKYYQLKQPQGASYCNSTVWFLKRKFSEYAKEDNWAKFAEEFNTRCNLPRCPGAGDIKSNDRPWFKLKDRPSSLQACVTCYFDYFYASEDEDKFEQLQGGDFDTRCDVGQLNLVIPMHHALEREDRSVFWKAAYAIDKLPLAICAACYEGIVKTVGGSRWFVEDRAVNQDETHLCCFNVNHARAGGSLNAYVKARTRGDVQQLADYVGTWTNVRPCPRVKHQSGKNRAWWGWGVVAICEECYLEFAKGTALEPQFALKGAREPDNERMCDLFSPRMRHLYTEACQTGDLVGFLQLAEQRHIVYTQTIMRCEQNLQQQQMAVLQAQNLGIQGSFYKHLGNVHDAAVGHSYTVGNAYAGYGHANEWVMKGHAYDRQAREVGSQVGGGSVLEVGMLEARWREVE
ncbi:hypothetical protein ACJZ2D_000830 [Fusarium nematophilum]